MKPGITTSQKNELLYFIPGAQSVRTPAEAPGSTPSTVFFVLALEIGFRYLPMINELSAFDNPFCFELNYNTPQPEAGESFGQVANRE
jgi:hypothetical protein